MRVTDGLVADGAKAIVIACNTATSAAGPCLRRRHPNVPFVGIEPALKPAVLSSPGDRILVMATDATLRLEKFRQLVSEWGEGSEVTCVPCVGLVELVEKGDFDSPELHDLLEGLVGGYRGKVDSVVLGCTHYPFVARQIREVVGDVPLFDGGAGTARQLRRVLESNGLLAGDDNVGSVEFSSSIPTDEELGLYRRLFSCQA